MTRIKPLRIRAYGLDATIRTDLIEESEFNMTKQMLGWFIERYTKGQDLESIGLMLYWGQPEHEKMPMNFFDEMAVANICASTVLRHIRGEKGGKWPDVILPPHFELGEEPDIFVLETISP